MQKRNELLEFNFELTKILKNVANQHKKLEVNLKKLKTIETDEINAFMDKDGNLIMLSGLNKWIINYSKGNEEYMKTFTSFILAHEIGHRIKNHVNKKRNAGVATGVAGIGLSLAGLGEVATIGNIAMKHGVLKAYSRKQEYEADKIAVILCHLAGYDIKLLPKFWKDFSGLGHKFDWFSTHPNDKGRMINIIKTIAHIDEELKNLQINSNPELIDEPEVVVESKPTTPTTVTILGHGGGALLRYDATFKGKKLGKIKRKDELKFEINESGYIEVKVNLTKKEKVFIKHTGGNIIVAPKVTWTNGLKFEVRNFKY